MISLERVVLTHTFCDLVATEHEDNAVTQAIQVRARTLSSVLDISPKVDTISGRCRGLG
jgi:hypothetical protein